MATPLMQDPATDALAIEELARSARRRRSSSRPMKVEIGRTAQSS